MPSLYSHVHLQNLCRKYGLNPSKKYGQNFLIDPEPVEKMIEVGELSEDDMVVEVGPGFGVLTEQVAPRVKKIFSFEIEKKLESYWDEKKQKMPQVEIIWGNVLKMFSAFISKFSPPPTYKVLANLPYQITSEVIRLFLEQKNSPELMVFMVQKEVCERICAQAGDMSLLSVAVQFYSKPEYIMTVPRSYFWPEPRVDSAIIKLIPQPRDSSIDEKKFFDLVRIAFANRRKLLIKNILSFVGKDSRSKIEEVLNKIGFDTNVRAQELSVDEWKTLYHELL
jgi:16S rRNA (adenine1518-N6/adenine1519-N6)-dimethyltransferase